MARLVGVSHKTVQRWLADSSRLPHPQHRWAVCDALGVAEEVVWPRVKTLVKSRSDREVVETFPYRSACPTSTWAELVDGARADIFLGGFTNYFVWSQQPAFPQTLRRKTEAGCRVRFLVGDPGTPIVGNRESVEKVPLSVATRIRITLDELAKLADVPGLESRFSAPEDGPNHIGLSVFRFDDEALVTPHLASTVGHDSPMMHLRRLRKDGMFDRFAEHCEELWERGRPVKP
ncbi:transcriptional regulator [Nocardiopsis ansamitocini]|uniref:Transcriptional regulator n=1 Tax=Nocardiopsis ansamitocini TaxID=1670832 RepID=A0A9W6UHF4_9ACTN|nr:transcriptional regulator [Nocardiopsis ansamitocini]